MIPLRLLAALALVPSLRVPPLLSQRPCAQDAARALAHAYVLSNPTVSEMPHDPPIETIADFVQTNPAVFRAGGPAVRCATALGARLTLAAATAYDPGAYERAMGVGPAELAPDVAQSINSGAVDLFSMGQELAWLAGVLPALAAGNAEPYLSTGTQTRQLLRQTLAIMGPIIAGDGEMAEMWQWAQGFVAQFQPIAEQQVFMLAMMVK